MHPVVQLSTVKILAERGPVREHVKDLNADPCGVEIQVFDEAVIVLEEARRGEELRGWQRRESEAIVGVVLERPPGAFRKKSAPVGIFEVMGRRCRRHYWTERTEP